MSEPMRSTEPRDPVEDLIGACARRVDWAREHLRSPDLKADTRTWVRRYEMDVTGLIHELRRTQNAYDLLWAAKATSGVSGEASDIAELRDDNERAVAEAATLREALERIAQIPNGVMTLPGANQIARAALEAEAAA